MPKSLLVDPNTVRQPDVLKTADIPVNQYKADFKKEEKAFGKDGMLNMLRDMVLIREFETMLDQIKKQGAYRGIEYNHKGPAHLSIGQESAAVGQAYYLDANDFIFGSHRSHGEILAKCFSAIRKENPEWVQKVMKDFFGGEVLSIVEKDADKEEELAEDFILYGVLAEIFARKTGFNRGLGGSMHTFFTPFGSYPNNAIVGGSGDICVGGALYKRINRKKGIVIGNIGDASLGCGPVWEGLMLSAMDQYRTLWDKEVGGAPPLILNVFNNFYGMGGQTSGETMGYKRPARMAAGVNPEAMHAETVDGYNPLAVADAIKRKRKIAENGEGPVFMETLTYRLSGHSPSDASSYRSKEEMEMWEQADCIQSYANYLIENKVISEAEFGDLKEMAAQKLEKTYKKAINLDISPRIAPEYISEIMYSNEKAEKLDDREPEVLLKKEDNPRVKALSKKSRFGLDDKGKPLSKMKTFALRDALFEAMLYRFYEDPTMIAYGEENRDWGGAFAVYRGLTEAIPYHRLFNSPISEGAIVGSAVGYALCGGRAVVELMYCDFMGRAGDEVFNQMAKWQSMSAGILKMPMVLRISVGNKYGAQHSQDWSAMVAHIPGLKVMYPVTPYDAKGMLNLALSGTDPVIFFESQKVYDVGEWFVEGGVPEGYYEVEEGEPAIRRQGKDITIITIGPALYKALEAADELKARYNLEAELIDARFINPLKYEKIVESVKKTGKCILVTDACERGSFMHNIANNISQLAFDYLDGPPVVVGSRNWITPAAELEEIFFPQKEWIIDSIHERILPLPGHQVSSNQTLMEMNKRNREGV